jgi:hypothetical protein
LCGKWRGHILHAWEKSAQKVAFKLALKVSAPSHLLIVNSQQLTCQVTSPLNNRRNDYFEMSCPVKKITFLQAILIILSKWRLRSEI